MIISEKCNNINYVQYVSNVLDENNEAIVHLLFKTTFINKKHMVKYKNNEWQMSTIEESLVLCCIDNRMVEIQKLYNKYFKAVK